MQSGAKVRSPKRQTQSSGRARRPRTFQCQALEDAFLKFCQLSTETDDTPLTQAEFAQLKREAENHIPSSDFDRLQAETEILEDSLLSDCQPTSPRVPKASKALNLPPHLMGLCREALLSPEQERQLFRRMNFLRYRAAMILDDKSRASTSQWDVERVRGLIKAAIWHRDCIVKANTRLVISIVKKFVNHQCSFDDLLSDGIMALLRSVDKFDYQLGFRFSTYATQVVRRNSYRLVMERQEQRLKVANSLSDPGLDVAEDSDPSTMSDYRWNLLRNHLSQLLEQLDRREKLIIRARFSLGAHSKVQTLQKLADCLGISKERVRQVEKRALEKLQALARQNPPDIAEVE